MTTQETEPASQPAEFEFSASHNELLDDLAGKMNFLGKLLLLIGVVTILVGAVGLLNFSADTVANLAGGVVTLLIGYWTLNASRSFQEIVDTEGHDISSLMGALGQLRNLYSLQYWLILIVFLLAVAGIIIAIVVDSIS